MIRLGRETSEWIGTDDTPSSGYWSPTNNDGASNMVEISATVYDNGGVGDSNVTEIVAFPSGNTAAASTFEVTAMLYNWQDELIATKSGAAVSEVASGTSGAFAIDGLADSLLLDPSADTSDGVDRPITYYQLDNLGEITAEYVFAGDGISLSSINDGGVPNGDYASDLRAESTFAYDAQGGLYQTSVYSVDQSTGTVDTGDPQVTSTLFDADGNIVQSTDPMGIVTTYAYNGAGEETQMQQADPVTDGSDGTDTAGYLTTSYGYDNDGNETSVTDPLGNATAYQYDAAGRETVEIDPSPGGDAPDPTILYAYLCKRQPLLGDFSWNGGNYFVAA